MSAVGQAIRVLREERGWTQAELSSRVGINQTGVSRRELGEIRVPRNEQKVFADVFGLTLDEFESTWRASRVHDRPAPARIPVINRGPAGTIQPYDHSQYSGGEFHDALEYIDRGDIDDGLAFALVIVGDSMEPALYAGDHAIFSPVTTPNPKEQLVDGDIVFVRFTPESGMDGVTVARWFQRPDGTIQLAKDNRGYAAVETKPEDLAQLAVCVERRTRRQIRGMVKR